MLDILKIYCFAKFYQDQNPDRDWNQYFTLALNATNMLYTVKYVLKIPIEFGLNSQTPQKVIVSKDGTCRQTDRRKLKNAFSEF